MKKAYSKPLVAFESFSLSVGIAADCEITNPQDDTLYYSGEGYLFVTGVTSCTFPQITNPDGDAEYDNICYHVVTQSQNLFNS